MSLVLVPTLLIWLQPEPGIAPQERYLIGPMRRLAHFSMRHARGVAVATVGLMAIAAVGALRLRVDTNHINFFAESHPLHQSAVVVDQQLSGVYSFNVLLEGRARLDEVARCAAADGGAAAPAGAAAVRAQGRVGRRLREAGEPAAVGRRRRGSGRSRRGRRYRPGAPRVRPVRRRPSRAGAVRVDRFFQGADLRQAGVGQFGPGVPGDRSGRARGGRGLRRHPASPRPSPAPDASLPRWTTTWWSRS